MVQDSELDPAWKWYVNTTNNAVGLLYFHYQGSLLFPFMHLLFNNAIILLDIQNFGLSL